MLGFVHGVVLDLFPREPSLSISADDGVLTIGFVLKPCLTKGKAKRFRRVGVALAKLLEAKATVAQYLPSDITGGRNLHGNADHLEGRPMPMRGQVAHELWCRGVVALVGWVGHASAVDNELFYAQVLLGLGDGDEGGGVHLHTALSSLPIRSHCVQHGFDAAQCRQPAPSSQR